MKRKSLSLLLLAFAKTSVNITAMKNMIILFLSILPLSGCVGAFLSGHSEVIDEDPPDITTIPCRSEATADRGAHGNAEQVSREKNTENLEYSKEQIKRMNDEIRQKYFGK